MAAFLHSHVVKTTLVVGLKLAANFDKQGLIETIEMKHLFNSLLRLREHVCVVMAYLPSLGP